MTKVNGILRIAFALILLCGAVFIAQRFDFEHFLVVPIFLLWLIKVWKEQAFGFFTREDDPYIFWPGVVLLVLALMFYAWAITNRFGNLQ